MKFTVFSWRLQLAWLFGRRSWEFELGAYPGGRTPGGPSESLILAPSELKNVALPPPPQLAPVRFWSDIMLLEQDGTGTLIRQLLIFWFISWLIFFHYFKKHIKIFFKNGGHQSDSNHRPIDHESSRLTSTPTSEGVVKKHRFLSCMNLYGINRY